jgi:hypothetical protein
MSKEEWRLLGYDAVWLLLEPTSSLIRSALIMDEIRTTETSVQTRATRRHISEDSILLSNRRENLKFNKGL